MHIRLLVLSAFAAAMMSEYVQMLQMSLEVRRGTAAPTSQTRGLATRRIRTTRRRCRVCWMLWLLRATHASFACPSPPALWRAPQARPSLATTAGTAATSIPTSRHRPTLPHTSSSRFGPPWDGTLSDRLQRHNHPVVIAWDCSSLGTWTSSQSICCTLHCPGWHVSCLTLSMAVGQCQHRIAKNVVCVVHRNAMQVIVCQYKHSIII